MTVTRWNRRFFATTRGRVLALLRGASRTVNELAAALGLTDNAVRAHLAALERDGLVRHAGLRPGARRPNYAYELTAEAEQFFTRAYSLLLDHLLGALSDRLPPGQTGELLAEAGRRIARSRLRKNGSTGLRAKLGRAGELLSELGGLARVERTADKFFLYSDACPLAAVVAEHPEACLLVEALLSEAVGSPVREHCRRQPAPRCFFEVVRV